MAAGMHGMIAPSESIADGETHRLSPQTMTNCTFTTALARTTAANVLVILAAGPLVTATICRVVLGKRLPTHTLVACSFAFFAVALCFGGSMSAADGLAGCVLAILSVASLSSYWTLSEYLGSGVSLMPCTVLGGAATSVVAAIVCSHSAPCKPACSGVARNPNDRSRAPTRLAKTSQALGSDLKGARPADTADFFGVVLSQSLSALAILLLTIGSAVTPPAEVSLMLLLETAVAPFLVFAVVGEKPSAPTAVAGAFFLAAWPCGAVLHPPARRAEGARRCVRRCSDHYDAGGAYRV